MDAPEWIGLGSLIVALSAFVASQYWILRRGRAQDDRMNTKLRVFNILGTRSLRFAELKERYQEEHGPISDDELEKALYEMILEKTAYFEHTDSYRARWRNPKKKKRTKHAGLDDESGAEVAGDDDED